MIAWSLFVGSFLDRFSGGTFVIMSINLFGDLIQAAVYLLLIFYFYETSKCFFVSHVVCIR